MMAISIALQNDEKWKNAEPTNRDVNSSITPLTTILKSPSVRILIGNDRIIKIGLIKTFRIANTKLASNAIQALLM